MTYIHERADWPNLRWSDEQLAQQLAAVRHRQGRLIGHMEALGFPLREEAVLQTLTQDVLKTSEIEGEALDATQVRSSLARRLGIDIGALPPTDRNVEGIITDRDIIVRAVAEGKNPEKEQVRDYMTGDVCCCAESDEVKDAARMMHDNNVSRLVVKDSVGKVRGILTFGSILRQENDKTQVSEIVACAIGNKAA